MVERAEPPLERIEPEKTIALVIETENVVAISKPKTAQSSTPMAHTATATAS